MKWRELNTFSKFLFVVMGLLAAIYLWREARSNRPEKIEATSSSPVVVARPEVNVKQFIESRNETKLVELLKNDSASVRDAATSGLVRIWQSSSGPEAERRLQAGMDMLAAGHPLAAVDQFSKIIGDHPNFAEAYNQRAMAYFSVEDYERSIQDCLKATELNKNHFGAWQGLGRCYLAIRRYDMALNAFERAHDLQPFSEETKRLIDFCTQKKKNVVPQDLNNAA